MALLATLALAAIPAEHVTAATAAARAFGYEPELLLAISTIESSHKANVIREARGGIACGPTQVRAISAKHCERLRSDVAFAYIEGARALRYFLGISGGDLPAALRGYGCGHSLGADAKPLKPARPAAKCNRFETRVLALRDRYRKAASS